MVAMITGRGPRPPPPFERTIESAWYGLEAPWPRHPASHDGGRAQRAGPRLQLSGPSNLLRCVRRGGGGGGFRIYPNFAPHAHCGKSALIGGVFAQCGHSAGTAPIITLFIAGTPLKTTHLQKHARSIQNSLRGTEFRTLGPVATGGGKQPTFRTARAQRTVRPHRSGRAVHTQWAKATPQRPPDPKAAGEGAQVRGVLDTEGDGAGGGQHGDAELHDGGGDGTGTGIPWGHGRRALKGLPTKRTKCPC